MPLQALVAVPGAAANDRLLQLLLSPRPPATPTPTLDLSHPSLPLPAPLRAALSAAFNPGQQAAIAACVAPGAPQLVLVQGPPGTGKTSSMVGMLSALLRKPPLPLPEGEVAEGLSCGTAAAAAAAGGGQIQVRHRSQGD